MPLFFPRSDLCTTNSGLVVEPMVSTLLKKEKRSGFHRKKARWTGRESGFVRSLSSRSATPQSRESSGSDAPERCVENDVEATSGLNREEHCDCLATSGVVKGEERKHVCSVQACPGLELGS